MTNQTEFKIITFDGESFEVQHSYKASPPSESYGAWANYHMHKDRYPTFITMNGEWYYGNDEAHRLLRSGRVPLMFIPNSEALWRRYQT